MSSSNNNKLFESREELLLKEGWIKINSIFDLKYFSTLGLSNILK